MLSNKETTKAEKKSIKKESTASTRSELKGDIKNADSHAELNTDVKDKTKNEESLVVKDENQNLCEKEDEEYGSAGLFQVMVHLFIWWSNSKNINLFHHFHLFKEEVEVDAQKCTSKYLTCRNLKRMVINIEMFFEE